MLPEWWVRAATRNQVEEVWMPSLQAGQRYVATDPASRTAADRREGYGYQWWMTPHGGYRAFGIFGQQCIVLPEQDAVIAITAALRMGEKRVSNAVWEHLFRRSARPLRAAPRSRASRRASPHWCCRSPKERSIRRSKPT